MITEAEQKILDNAPEWATHHMSHDVEDDDYAVLIDGSYYDNTKIQNPPLGAEYGNTWHIIPLADIRKKQGETVVDEKPVYTQAMKDAGEIPVIGMEVLIHDEHDIWGDAKIFLSEKSTVMATFNSLAKDKPLMVSVSLDTGLSCCFRVDMCKPIDTRTPEQKQVDKVTEIMFNLDKWHHDSRTVAEHLQKAGLLAAIK